METEAAFFTLVFGRLTIYRNIFLQENVGQKHGKQRKVTPYPSMAVCSAVNEPPSAVEGAQLGPRRVSQT